MWSRTKLFYTITFLAIQILYWVGCTKPTPPPGPTPNVNTNGEAMFWIASDIGCGTITVICNGTNKNITSYNSSGSPSCGSSGTATFTLPPGTYNYTATCSTRTWSGSVSISSNNCTKIQLTSTSGSGGGSTPTNTTPNTLFISSSDYAVSNFGANWTNQFTISNTQTFAFRFTSQYKAQAAIITQNQLSNFQSNASFTGYALFNNTIGTNYVTLSAGTYYVAVRNTNSGTNKWSLELDYDITLPGSDKATFVDNYLSETRSLAAGSRLWQPFTIQSGYRYFVDGCNVNCSVYVIPSGQLSAFQNGQSFQYYSEYYKTGGSEPGLFEIKLPAGSYYLVSHNSSLGAITYTMERWRVN